MVWVQHEVKVQDSVRFGFTALSENRFIGCSSGLAYKNEEEYSGWFYLTDLFVEKAYRHRSIGTKLLTQLEEKIRKLGIQHIWTWTAEYEAPLFYERLGYYKFTELENWYSNGYSRIGYRKEV